MKTQIKQLGILAAHSNIMRAKALGIPELETEAREYHAQLKAKRDEIKSETR